MKKFIEIFQKNAEDLAGKIALVYENESITYQELNLLSCRIAGLLKARGIGKEMIVPVLLPRGIDYISAEIGILMAGGVFAPLALEYPKERIEYIKKDCQCTLIIDEDFINEARKEEPINKIVEVELEDGAIVIYTSGSTGNPKGIVHDHLSFNSGVQRQLFISAKKDSIALATAPLYFIVAISEIFAPLWAGATIHILSEKARKDIREIETYIDEHRITDAFFNPFVLEQLPDKVSSIKNIFSGGDRLTGIYKKHTHTRCCYGLSESLGIGLYFDIDKSYDNTPIGKPLEDFKVYILDNQGKEVVDGEEGEICISGPLARGYLNLPEETKKTFRKNPFSTNDLDQRILYTNDLGKKLPDGNILFINRKDWMVKINGQRVEIGEIEIQLRKMPKIEIATVKSFKDKDGQTYLCAYYQCANAMSKKEIRKKLEEKLPEYMIPAFFIALESFPTTPTGKIDRKLLLAPEVKDFKSDYEKPRNNLEKEICLGFEKVLRVENIGIKDDFFELGGDSIKVILLQEVLEEFKFSAESIFKGKTPEGIASLKDKTSFEAIKKVDLNQKHFLMTDSQLGIYLECIQNPKSCMYNNSVKMYFPKGMDTNAKMLKENLEKLISTYPFMKVKTELVNGNPMMVYASEIGIEVVIIKEKEISEDEKIQKFVKSFDLEKGPLFRFEIHEEKERYLLLGDMHHIISDGKSIALFFENFARQMEGKTLFEEDVNSFDVSQHEINLKDSLRYKESREYFDQVLGEMNVDSNLMKDEEGVTDHKENGVMTFELREKDFQLIEKTKSFGVTENTLFLSAFAYALAKTNGQKETFFCTVDNGRHQLELKNTLGMLVRTLPFYIEIQEEASCETYIKKVQEQVFSLIKAEACSFVELAEAYPINSDIVFVYQGETLSGSKYKDQEIPLELIKTSDSMVNFSLDVFKKKEGYLLHFEYRKDWYSEETINNFKKLYIQVIKGILNCHKLLEIPLIDEEDKEKIQRFNENPIEFNRDLTMVDLFKKQVKENPKNLALSFKEIQMTYEELNHYSEALAIALTKEGIKAEMPIGIMVKRNERFPICTLGVLKAGGACLPLDATYPPERLEYMIEDSKAAILIMDKDLQNILPRYSGKIIFAEEIWNMPLDKNVILQEPKAENLFALLYTSGSTGKPKGCMLEHRNLVNFCLAFQEQYQITSKDRASAYGSFSFDASMQEIYPYLTCGAGVYIIPEEIRLDLPKIHEFLTQNRITMFDCTTQLGRQYVCDHPENPTLKILTVGGEKLIPCQPPTYDFVNTYGPTECTIYITDFYVNRYYHSVPIGKTFGNCDAYIIDSYQRLLPPGVPGELAVGGYPVTRGYFNREEMTREKYKKNPFNSEPGYEKIYLTGDVCRFLPNGNIQFIGRRDEQVKIRGFRIEMTEIERRILEFSGIDKACVVACDLPSGGKMVGAYIVSEIDIEIGTLNKFIKETLPDYMVPTVTMQIENLPLSPNGKIDRKKLPELKSQKKSKEKSKTLNSLEQKIIGMIEEITGGVVEDLEENLVSFGLSSLSTIILASKIYEQFKCQLKVSELMEKGNVLMIEEEILKKFFEKKERLSQEKKEIPDKIPLSSAQLGVYYDAMKRPEDLVYNMPMLYTLSSKIKPEDLKNAVEKVIKSHSIFSVSLEMEEEKIYQAIHPEKPVMINIQEIKEDQLQEKKVDFLKPFDLFREPLYRMKILKTEKNSYFLFDVHHLIFDGISLEVFWNDMKSVLETQEDLIEETSFFESVMEETNAEKETKVYYDALFKDYEKPAEILFDLKGDPKEGRLKEYVVAIDPKSLERFCKEKSLTPAQVFLAGGIYTISRYSTDEKVYFSALSGGRENALHQKSLGMFVKTLPVKGEIPEKTDVLTFIKSSGRALQETMDKSKGAYLKILRNYGYVPKINFACQLGLEKEIEICGEILKEEILSPAIPKFNLSIHIELREGVPAICLQYNDALYLGSRMKGFGDAMAMAIENMIAFPEKNISEISLLNEKNAQLIKSFEVKAEAEINAQTLHECFEKKVRLYPHKKALTVKDETFTYEALNAEMNRVAWGLLEKGLEKGDRVGILLPRSSQLILSIYGVLKAGGAYIPCDPQYPKERISYILEDSQAKYLITTQELMKNIPGIQGVDIEELRTGSKTENPEVSVTSEDLAYLIYTSGSTGKPKGVMLKHLGITNYLMDHPGNIHTHTCVKEGNVMVSVTTISFDMSLKEIGVALSNGLSLVLADENEANDPNLLAELIKKNQVDIFNATPSRMTQYMMAPEFLKVLSKMKLVMCGGEKMPLKLLKSLQEIRRESQGRIINTYGPTEITVSSNGSDLTDAQEVTVGPPLLNVKAFIVDFHGNKLPPGVTGELYIGGFGVSKGYVNKPELTEKSFVNYQGNPVYKTGDYGYWTEDGEVVILGRKDQQIKLRGLRIELSEIETAFLKHQGIKEVLIRIREINGNDHLCAYFTASKEIKIEDIKEELKKSLTHYMIPTAYCRLEKMPLTPNGKRDDKSLPTPELSQNREIILPENETEEILCGVYKEILGLKNISVTDSFFDLGGTSLTVTNLLIKANKEGLQISYGDVFKYATPRKLSAILRNEKIELKEKDEDRVDFDKVLNENTIESFIRGKEKSLGNILLTGGTGFLGTHLLKEYLESETGKVYCLLRGNSKITGEERLKSKLFYYFENSFEEDFGKRIFVVEGDVTKNSFIRSLESASIQTVINSAALVKHFSKGNEIEEVNAFGVKNLIEFCKGKNAALIQISTTSVAGDRINNNPPKDVVLDEKSFYIGQNIENQYVHSKFMAEKLILEGIEKKELQAKIMRVGNLSPRELDGEFQVNFTTNGFMGRLKAYAMVGAFPYSGMNRVIKLAPIESTAKAILKLSKTPEACCVFHPYNNHFVPMGDIIFQMKALGIKIDLVEDQDFEIAIEKVKNNPQKAKLLTTILAYENMDTHKRIEDIHTENEYTIQVLFRLGFKWPETSGDYMNRFLKAISNLGFFIFR